MSDVLALGQLLSELPISQACVAKTMGISPAGLSKIINKNEWPVRANAKRLKALAEQALKEAGAKPAQLKGIWAPIAEPVVEDDEECWEPEMLTEQAKQFFKLSRDPFQNEIGGEQDVFLNRQNRNLLEEITTAASAGSMLAVIGECGSGKTILKHLFLHRMAQNNRDLVIIEPRRIDRKKITAEGISAAICRKLQINCAGMNGEERDAKIEDALIESTENGHRHVLIIDEAHDLTRDVIKLIKRVWELTSGFQRVMGVVLIGQPELRHKLAGDYVREFTLRCAQYQVAPLGFDIPAYVTHKFARLGMDVSRMFEEDALKTIRGKCLLTRRLGLNSANAEEIEDRSYPLTVNNVVIRALNIAAQIGEPVITEKLMLQEV
ncbi:ExeA family protein [Agarivorans gilvus]|uniref:ATPase AAA n=1 Tax=Agarivorans gilvus TaxID=680279 RepID=A0ABQ1HYV5_9ALTE|nr:AAA family ATPase [Agarivorans gilvus]GGA95949.1 ATPase AAA [Agarivorans gilvus]